MKRARKSKVTLDSKVTLFYGIKVPVKLKLQLRRHTDTLIFTLIHLMHISNDLVFMWRIEENHSI